MRQASVVHVMADFVCGVRLCYVEAPGHRTWLFGRGGGSGVTLPLSDDVMQEEGGEAAVSRAKDGHTAQIDYL